MIDPNKMIHASSKADVRIENVKYYNISKTAQKAWHQHDETRKTVGQRVSAGKKGKKLGIYSEDHKRRISEGKKAAFAKRRAETGQNYASTDSWKGRGKGQKLSSDHRANIGAGLYQAWASGTRKRAWRTPKITEIIPWRVISPTGEEHRVTNLKQFCVEHELTNTNITKACGSKGWRALRAACA